MGRIVTNEGLFLFDENMDKESIVSCWDRYIHNLEDSLEISIANSNRIKNLLERAKLNREELTRDRLQQPS